MLKSVASSFAVSRAYIFLAAAAGYHFLPAVERGKSVPLDGWAPWFASYWYRWDANWYMSVIREGYEWADGMQSNVAFFPLYPMLVRASGWLLGGSYLLAGLLLSLSCLFAAMVYLYRLAEMDHGAATAGRAVWFIAIFPTAFFFNSFYTESLFLLASIGAFYHARKDDWALAGLWGLVAALTRVTGLLLVIPLAWEYLSQRSFSPARVRPGVLWLGLIPCGTLAYSVYLQREFDRPLAFIETQIDAWSHKFTPFFGSLRHDIDIFFTRTHEAWVVYEILTIIFMLVMLVVGFRYLRGSYSLYVIISLLFVLVGGSVRSMSRYTLMVFPVFILLGLLTAGRPARWALSAVSLGLLGVSTAVFVSGRWIA